MSSVIKIDDLFTSLDYKFSIITNNKGEIIYSEYAQQGDSQKEKKIQQILQAFLTNNSKVPLYCKKITNLLFCKQQQIERN
jgi:hypothetical protein